MDATAFPERATTVVRPITIVRPRFVMVTNVSLRGGEGATGESPGITLGSRVLRAAAFPDPMDHRTRPPGPPVVPRVTVSPPERKLNGVRITCEAIFPCSVIAKGFWGPARAVVPFWQATPKSNGTMRANHRSRLSFVAFIAAAVPFLGSRIRLFSPWVRADSMCALLFQCPGLGREAGPGAKKMREF